MKRATHPSVFAQRGEVLMGVEEEWKRGGFAEKDIILLIRTVQ